MTTTRSTARPLRWRRPWTARQGGRSPTWRSSRGSSRRRSPATSSARTAGSPWSSPSSSTPDRTKLLGRLLGRAERPLASAVNERSAFVTARANADRRPAARRRGGGAAGGAEGDHRQLFRQPTAGIVGAVEAPAQEATKDGPHHGADHDVAAFVVGEDVDRLVCRKHPVRRGRRGPTDAHDDVRACAKVAEPVRLVPEARHYDGLAGRGVVADHLQDGVVQPAGLPTAVRELE